MAVLEEPEHLTWYHHGKRWTDKFQHVVGIMHTNYLDYARREEGGAAKAAILRFINGWVCRAHCHKVIKLSDAVQDLPRQCTQFVHGVSPQFLQVGAAKAEAARARAQALAPTAGDAASPEEHSSPVWPRGAYFLGKVVWAKGYTELLDLLEKHQQAGHVLLPINVYGSGADKGVCPPPASWHRIIHQAPTPPFVRHDVLEATERARLSSSAPFWLHHSGCTYTP